MNPFAPGYPIAPPVPETTKTVTELLPKRDRSRNMGAHTECMCANDYETQQLCTKFTSNSKLKQCRHVRFEFMCDWVKEMDS